MLKIYDSEHNFLKMITSQCKDLYVTETLSTGFKTLCFKVPCLDEYIECMLEENYVETENYNYVIKEINMKDNNFITIYCNPDIENLTGIIFTVFDCFEKGIEDAYKYCLSIVDDWEIEYHSEDRSILTYQLSNTTPYEMITKIAEDYGQEVWYDTKEKKVHIYDKMGKSLGAYYSNELKLKQLNKQSSTYDYATVLYPIGKDGLLITEINNGLPFIENFSYTNKRIEKIWINEDYDVPELLKKNAEIYLNEISQPRASYKLTLSDLGEKVAIGDEIILVDKIKKIRQKQRVVKIIRYPFTPEKDSLEISNLQVNFANQFIKNQKKIEADVKYLRELINSLE